MITGIPIAYDDTNTNPKYITQYLSMPGIWNLVIYHGLLTANSLTPFSIVVETDATVNQCINFCTSIPYSQGLTPGYTDHCLCQTSFYWDTSTQQCIIDCASLNFNGDLGSTITGSIDKC